MAASQSPRLGPRPAFSQVLYRRRQRRGGP